MASPFDPKSWSPLRAAELGKSWLDQWVATTASWVDPVATLSAGTVTALLPDVVLTVLTDGILSRFLGQQLELAVGQTPVSGLLTDLAVRRRGAAFECNATLIDAAWDRYPVEKINCVANGVRLIPGVPSRIDIDTIDLTGTVTVAAVVDWLNSHGLDWTLAALPNGQIRATHRRRRLTAVVEASVHDDLVRIETVSAKWRGVPVSGGMVPVRHITLDRMPSQMRLVYARRVGPKIAYRLELARTSSQVDIAQIRNAIMAGSSLVFW